MDSFEIRTLTDKQWSTDSRCNDEQEALRKANTIAGKSYIDGVKVVQELYDEEAALFREKTIFSYFKQDEKVFNPDLDKKKDAPAPKVFRAAHKKRDSSIRSWLMVAGVLLSVAGNIALAVLWSGTLDNNTQITKRGNGGRPGNPEEMVIYDLPAVTMNFDDNGKSRTVTFQLGLELNSKDDIRNIHGHLTDIINSVASDLNKIEGDDLHSKGGMDKSRASLHTGIQSAAGDAPVEGVLFRNVHIF